MAALLAADGITAGAHLFQHVAVAYSGAGGVNANGLHILHKAQVGHNRHHGGISVQAAAVFHILGNQRNDLVAVDLCALFIAGQAAVCIAVKGNAAVKAAFHDLLFQPVQVGGAAAIVDGNAVIQRAGKAALAAQAGEQFLRHLGRSTIGAVKQHIQAGKICINVLLQSIHIVIHSGIQAVNAADLGTITDLDILAVFEDMSLNAVFYFIGQLVAIALENLDAVELYLVRKYGADAGIVISASHNPMEFNGIKIFAGTGYKLPDEVENQIEAYIDNDCAGIELKTGAEVGRVYRRDDGLQDYVDHLYESIHGDLTGLNVCIDCANGASAAVAQKLFPRLGAKCTFIGIAPDGENINKGVGSTHLENLEKAVVEGGFDCGIAFDGDADRCLGCDEKGQEMDGDKIIALLAMTMKEKGRLDGDTAVVTVMSNLGFIKYMESQGINTEKTAVGDRYVLENMRENGFSIGGEQSGHVILLHHATTGDGELTAGKLLKLLAESGKKMSELNGIYAQYPQVLVNVTANAAQKKAYKEDEVLAGFIENEQQKLMGMGRVLVRVSGTEPKIRVMVEGQDLDAIHRCADRIVDKINKRILGQ